MAVNRQCGIFYLLVFVIFCTRVSRQFVQKIQLACHSSGTCGSTQLSCDINERLAILNARHVHHANITQYDMCDHVEVLNCSQVQESCCLLSNVSDLPSADCGLESYEQTTLLDVHRNCSGAAGDLTLGENFTCSVQLPPLPQVSSGLCAKTGKHQSASSYSYVDYACITDSDISTLCGASEKTGSLLYVLWTPADAQTLENDWTNATCTCRVTSPTAEVFVRTLDVRLPAKPGVEGACSSVSVTDTRTTHFKTPCGANSSVFLFDPGFQQNARIHAVTPFDLTLSLNVKHVPEMVWLGFQRLSTNSGDLKLTCYKANEEIVALGSNANGFPSGTAEEDYGNDNDPNVGAIVGGSVGGAVVIVILGFICLYFYTKRRAKNAEQTTTTSTASTKSKKRESWWEKTREQDRIAQLSQLGPASAVIIDDRRNMGYGKHRPTRQRYRYTTTEENPPIFVVPGSAVVQNPGVQIVELDDDDGGNIEAVATGEGVFWAGGGGATLAESYPDACVDVSSVDHSGDFSGRNQGYDVNVPAINVTGGDLYANPLDNAATGATNSTGDSMHKKSNAPDSNATANALDVTSSQGYVNGPASGAAGKGPFSTVLTIQKPQNPKDKEAGKREALADIQRARQKQARGEGREAAAAVTVHRERDNEEPTVSYSRFVSEGGGSSQD